MRGLQLGQLGFVTPRNFEIELIYSLLLIIICLFIYFRTKEMFDLTGHKGIKYFRQTFLYFALAYFLRFIAQFYQISTVGFYDGRILISLSFILFAFASLMAVLSITNSVIWKKLEKTPIKSEYIFYTFAIVIAIIVFFTKSLLLLIAIQGALLFFATATSYLEHYDKKKTAFSKMYILYLLLFVFWIFNLYAQLLPPFYATERIIIYAISTALFIFILAGVIKRTEKK